MIKEKNVLTIEKHSFEDSVKLLERVALALSLMNVQTLVYEELKKCLDNNESNVTECLRYDLLRNEDGHFSFKYNAFGVVDLKNTSKAIKSPSLLSSVVLSSILRYVVK